MHRENFKSISSIIFLKIIYQVMYVEAGYFRYCDQGKVVNVSQSNCASGVNFGLEEHKQPSCVCVQGVYRVYSQGCSEDDGFAIEEVCSKLTDTDTGVVTYSMKLATLPPNFDWKAPGIACSKEPGAVWSITQGPNSVKTKNKNFYVMNGQAFGMPDSTICIAKANLGKDFICRYFKEYNPEWPSSPTYTVSVQDSCSGGTKLKKSECFGSLSPATSECDLDGCQDDGSTDGGVATPGQGSSKVPTKKPQPFTKKPATKPTLKITKNDLNKNCTDPKDYQAHDNRFLNRKMLLYNVVNQLDMRNDSEGVLAHMEPNMTLGLFDLMKNISKKVCPKEYVKNEWVDQAVDLFYILHKGDLFRYEESLELEQYQWILEILNQCDANASNIILTTRSSGENDDCGSENGLATGYCKPTEDSPCEDYVPVTVELDGEDSHRSKHYVPELAWNIVDLIHVACFPQFNESYRMFHVLEQAVEKLFTLQIKNLWHFPGWLEKTKTKLLGYGADNNMYNFEVCIQGAYGIRNDDLPRLVRPFAPTYLRKKRAAQTNAEKVFIQKPRGFATTATGYQNPGRLAHVDAVCVKSPSDLKMPPFCAFS